MTTEECTHDSTRRTAWVFTVQNYTPSDELYFSKLKVKYLVYGREIAPTTGTPHLQGFLVGPKRDHTTWMKFFPFSYLAAKSKYSTFEEAIAYCKKDGDYIERGKPPLDPKQKGNVNAQRWEHAREAAKAGDLDSIPADIYVKYYRTLKCISKDHPVPPSDADSTTGLWFYGAAGAGKSRKAREDFPKAYLKPCNKWWDGYQPGQSVIIDDIDKNHACLGHHLKIWADRYSFIAETKGGAMHIRPPKVCVTSQYHIDEIWEDKETQDALKRRFKIVHFDTLFSNNLY